MPLLPIVAGGPGNQFNSSTDQRSHPLNSVMVFGDGRRFVYARAGAVALAAADVQQSAAPTAAHVLQTLNVAAAVGDRTVQVILGATAVGVDEYKDGILAIELGTGFGYTYTIDSHAAVALSGTFTVPIKEGVQVAIPTTANTVSLIRNPSNLVVQAPVTTLTGSVVGIAPKVLAINAYGWLARSGPAVAATIGTMVIGANAVSPTGTTAGCVGPSGASTSVNVGRVLHVATTTNKTLVDLSLD